MAYVDIGEIVLKTDFIARDITIVNYNSSLSQIKAYLTKLDNNVKFMKQDILREADLINLWHYGEDQPSTIEEGDFWMQVIP